VIQAVGQVVPLKLDVDRKEVAPIAAKYSVSAIPALFVIDADGKVIGTIEFTPEPAKFVSQLQRILSKHKPGSPPAGKKLTKR